MSELRPIKKTLQNEIRGRQLSRLLIRRQEEERSRIGRELHDHVSQSLALLTIRIDQLRAEPAITPTMASVLHIMRESASELNRDVHALSHRLHSATLDILGLVPALERLVREVSSHHGISVELAHASMPTPLPSDVSLCLFRVVEESLTNVSKHSQARWAQVRLRGAADGIHLAIEDDGRGFDVARRRSRAGLGFVSMQERLCMLRGSVRIESVPKHGTRVSAWIPWTSIHAAPPS